MIATALGLAVAAAGAAAHGAFHRNSAVFGRVLSALPSHSPAVALTFDDGPNPEATPRVLDALARDGDVATFFVLGRHAERWPALVRRIASEGHEIGNHGWHHRKLHASGPRAVRRDLTMGADAINGAAGVRPRFFRAPHGFRSPWVSSIAASMGQRTVGWTLGVRDTDRPGVLEIERRTLHGARPGAIILLHDGDGYDPDGDRMQTADALPGILARLRERGLSVAPLPLE